uniref:maturase K n=1 Tax=Pleurozia acinosa TaxID=3063155 RepID=UPI00286D0944|nr:maturase K [Pleurozia acinosa]WKR34967.1 maturase K [Pleurozia acinosa]
MTKVFSEIRELKKIKKNSYWQKPFLYPLLFQDDLYGIAYNRFVNKSKYQRNKFYGLSHKFNFLTLKRLIKKLHQSKNSWIISNKLINQFQFVQEIIIIISNIIFSFQSEVFAERTKDWNSSQSIHSVFPFIEDRIYNSSSYLDIKIPYSLHPEIFIRIIRQHILDISFLHFLRLLLHWNDNIMILDPFYSKKNQFYRFLWNFHIHKIEYSLIHICKEIAAFQSTSFWFFLNKTDFVRKIRNLSEQSDFEIIQNIMENNISIHYVRYKNNSILTTNGNIKLLKRNWKILLIVFWEKYFHLWPEPYRIFVKNSSVNPIYILGYILRTIKKSIVIQFQFVDYSIDTDLVTKEFCSIIPIIPSIRLLTKEKFCDTSGRPICKLSWTTLTDHEIFQRFDQIIKNIFYFYGGCYKKKGLYQLQYILRFSCAKTLACKHKSTIRIVWKKYGSNFIKNSIYLKKIESISSISWQTNANIKKFWYLNITQINYLANLLQKLKNI